MPIITLTTDFGLRDGFVGTLKGVILGISPLVQIVDISHAITPQNILEGAVRFITRFSFFPRWHHSRGNCGPRCGHPSPPHCCPAR